MPQSPHRQASLGKRRELRAAPTEAEKALWRRLQRRQVEGAKFRRQHSVGPFVADFCCVERGLIIELDGGQHAEPDTAAYDARRSAYLNAQGFRVLRYWNAEVFANTDGVVSEIAKALAKAAAEQNGNAPPP